MRVFFIGTVLFSRRMLEILIENKNIQIIGLATKSKSNFNSDHSDLSDLGTKNNIPFKYIKDINSDNNANWIKNLKPDVIFCLGWSSLLKKNILDIPPRGVIGFHPTELPYNKGRHPIIWALVLGLERTASTFFLMDEQADSGIILDQQKIEISINDDAQSLYNKITVNAEMQLNRIINDIITDSLKLKKQEKNSGNVWRKREKTDGRIDWRMRSIDIYNLVRALNKPYPGAYFEIEDIEIKVWKCNIPEMRNTRNIEPGKVIKIENKTVLVKTGDGYILLVEHELDLNKVQEYLL